jgi:hypothetical protein
MIEKSHQFIELIHNERERYFNLPGAEWDSKNNPNDWVAKAAKYLSRNVGTGLTKPSVADFQDDLIKSAAVILAALEHIDSMKIRKELE